MFARKSVCVSKMFKILRKVDEAKLLNDFVTAEAKSLSFLEAKVSPRTFLFFLLILLISSFLLISSLCLLPPLSSHQMRARGKFIATFNPIQHGATWDWESQQVTSLTFFIPFLLFWGGMRSSLITSLDTPQHVWEHLYDVMDTDSSEMPLVLSEVSLTLYFSNFSHILTFTHPIRDGFILITIRTLALPRKREKRKPKFFSKLFVFLLSSSLTTGSFSFHPYLPLPFSHFLSLSLSVFILLLCI